MAGADDGNRQVALTVDQIAIALGLNPAQFEALDLKLGGIHGAVDKLAENISEPDTSLAAEVIILGEEVQSLKNEISVGFSGLQQSLANLNNTIMDRSIDLAKWLAAIALAASTPDDNSAEVQAKIDEATASMKSSTDALDAAVQANKPK